MKKIALFFASIVAAISFMAVPAYAEDACDYYNGPDKDIICGNHDEEDAEDKVGTIIKAVLGIVGIIAVIVIVIAGIFYATSQGDAGKISRAKSAILFASIGLIISLLSFAIVSFILGKMS
ncbi:hypothetical protein IK110_03030 [Candidatus Saccharibacteria bacterium]|nr:hypothetical protein [Candidatus Saccharibacteria bacterium]